MAWAKSGRAAIDKREDSMMTISVNYKPLFFVRMSA